DYTARLRREMAESADPAARPPGVKGARRARSDGKHADDMALVTAKNIGRYAGWTKNRYGRPVLKYSIIRPDGRRFTYDPIRCAKSYERLAGAVSGKRLSDLEWEYSAERAQEDFAQARRLPSTTVSLIRETEQRLAKRRRIEEDSKRAKERLLAQSTRAPVVPQPAPVPAAETEQADRSKGDRSKGDGGFESDADSDIPDLESLERSAGAGAVYAAFDDAEEVAALMTTAPAELSRELREKLASGAFDSSSDDDSDSDQMPAAPAGRIRPRDAVADSGAAMSAEDIALDEERKRTAAILARLVGSTADTVDSPAGVLELGEMDAEPHDGASGKASKSASSTPDSSSSSGSSSASSDDSSSDSSSGGSPTGSPSNNGSSGADDSDSDDDSNPTSSGSSSSDADSDSDSEDEEDKADAMDVDESDRPTGALKSLFGKTDGEAAAGGQFLFTEMLGLEADQRAAALEAEAAGDYAGPVTGGSRVAGPAERNLNANRLPMFFPDVDAPTFRRPEAAFQRQKTEEELEADLANARHELADEYKALQRASVRRARKLRQPAP
ncbi:hypothetical protein H4R21_003242, partial [Coemansia helicoidea]